ncbi:hypothetical protein J421_2893 [Gemmatirosa kalamazoonensis]|uniref:Uncharacterized protein n=1 Tax=Gemmatirosa kalamazoonensis TaxID=861299 RepID=W0RJC2_9BACT|nr:hypothetical protein [Gemmatirosa kalamazoonensis]AHG90430.1 hypothetical protein J421_2893 [Gemmatirosa kalamazoonensis]
MYSTCLFCHQPLGRNDVLESFPVGRRLAYDAARGRLWVVCPSCERWNLTPLDARWEAIEEAERQFRGTRLRVSTDQVGLARLREGLELVRIGAPMRPELAAWRYGDQFGRRRRRALYVSAGVAAAGAATVLAGPVLGLVSLGAVSPAINLVNFVNAIRHVRRTVVAVRIPGHEVALEIRSKDLTTARIRADREHGFVLHVEGVRRDATGWLAKVSTGRAGAHTLSGEEALRVAAMLLPKMNANGAPRGTVRDAVDLLETARTPAECFALVAEADRRRLAASSWVTRDPGILRHLPLAARLALEMAAHEESERRAMEGELAELERAWRDAEEIAAIADDLELPTGVRGAFARLKERVGAERAAGA